ncbi:hypothetical protein [Thomasclavelia ramosa]|uniref:hypothetical protein n=1 Tax=Thomasclavelia ramosa TaxID=1547 RepID=UPI002594EFC0|nr:hypothetical protein [uncultured Thomasclavelia sp.]
MVMYNINEMSLNDFKNLIASGDDSHNNQIRVTTMGEVFLSQDIVGAEDLEGIAFRLETFDAGNDYVGKPASEDNDHVVSMYNAIKANWDKNLRETYLNNWRIKKY